MPTTDDILSGLAFAIGLGNKIRDPNRKQRDRLLELLQARPDLIQQYKDQDNPEIAKVLAGLKPRFGPKGNYEQLTGLINNAKESPEVTRSKYLRDILSNPSAGSSISASPIGALGDIANNIERKEDKEEYLKTGKIRTSQEKEADRLALTTRRNQNAESAARLEIAQADAAARKAKEERLAAARPIYASVVARLSKPDSEGKAYTNLYEAIVKGKVSGDESNALYALDSEYNDRLKNDRMIYQDQMADKLGAEQKALYRENSAVTNLIEDARSAGQYLSSAQAQLAIRNPQAALQDPIVGPILEKLRDFNRKKVLPAAKASFLRETDPVRKEIVKKGGKATLEDVEAHNNASMMAYGSTGFEPIVFGLKTLVKDMARDKDVIVIKSGDPELIKEYKGLYEVETQEKKEEGSQSSSPKIDLDGWIAALPPNTTDEQIRTELRKIYKDEKELEKIVQQVINKRKKSK